jgi:hypothetical protein
MLLFIYSTVRVQKIAFSEKSLSKSYDGLAYDKNTLISYGVHAFTAAVSI